MVPPLGSRVTFSGAGRHPPALRYPGQPDTLLVREQGVLTAAIGVSLPDAARPTRGPALSARLPRDAPAAIRVTRGAGSGATRWRP